MFYWQCTNQRLQTSGCISGLLLPCCLWSFGTKMGMKYEIEPKANSMIFLSLNRRYAKEEIFFIIYNCYHNQLLDFLTQIWWSRVWFHYRWIRKTFWRWNGGADEFPHTFLLCQIEFVKTVNTWFFHNVPVTAKYLSLLVLPIWLFSQIVSHYREVSLQAWSGRFDFWNHFKTNEGIQFKLSAPCTNVLYMLQMLHI